MLSIQHLNVSYHKHPVLFDINLELEKGIVHGLVGLNGSGKTTLIHTIFGITSKTSGEVLWEGKPIHRSQIALLETGNYFYQNITANEYLNIFPLQNQDFDREAWAKLFHLPLDELVTSYSTGMKKKLALMAILQLDRPLIMLDEPYNGLDMEAVKVLEMLLVRLKEKGKTFIVTSHIVETMLDTCDKIHLLRDGEILRSYFPPEYSQAMQQDLFGDFEDDARQLINSV